MIRLALISLVALLGIFGGIAQAQTYTWNNTTTLWSTGFDVTPVSDPATALVFNGTADITATNDLGAGTFTVNSIAISNTGTTTIAPFSPANSLTFAGTTPAITIAAGSGATTISTDVIYSVATSIANNGSTLLTLGGAQALNANLTFSGTGAYTISGVVTYTAARTITNNGTGLLTLSAAHTPGANLTFAGTGASSITGATTLAAARTITNNGTGLLTLGAVGMGANALTISGTGNTTISGIISGTIAAGTSTITKTGSGTLRLSGANTFKGNITLSAGTLSIGAAGTLGLPTSTTSTNTISIGNGTTIISNANLTTTTAGTNDHVFSLAANATATWDTGTFTVSILGNQLIGTTGTLNKIGTGLLTLGSSGTATIGTINVNAGRVRVTSQRTGSVQNLNVNTLGQFEINDDGVGAAFSIAAGRPTTLNGSGPTGSTTPGAFVFTDQTPTGAASASPVATWGNTVTLATDSTVGVYNGTTAGRYNTLIFSQVVSGPGNLIKAGPGILVLSAAGNSFGGANGTTTVLNGGLQIRGGDDRLPTTTSLVLGSATANTSGVFDLNGQNQTIVGLNTAGTGTANKVLGTSTGIAPVFTVNYSGTGQTYSGNLGGTIDLAGVTVPGDNLAFTKAGTGSLTLSGTNTYSGSTTVNAGTLVIGNATSLSANSPAITVASGAVLDLTAVPSGYNFAATQTLRVGRTTAAASDVLGGINVAGTFNVGGTGTAAAATIEGNAVFNAATLRFDLNNTPASGNDLAVVNGGLTFSGSNTLVITKLNGPLSTGSYTLFTYTGSLTGAAGNFTIAGAAGGRQTAAIDTASTPGSVQLAITGTAGNLTWVGNAAGNVWDQATTANFTGATNNDNRFYDGDTVTFNATGVGGTTPVLVAGALSPSVMTINGAQNYTFGNGGSGSITGTGNLVLNGTGTVTFGVPVTLTGTTTLNTGTLTFANGGSFAGAVTVAGGTLNANLASTLTGTVTVNGGTVNTTSDGAFTGSVSITGGTFLALNPTGTAINNASITVSGTGVLQIGNGGTVGDLAGTVTLSSGGTVAFNRSDASGFTSALGFTGTGNIVNTGTAAVTLSTNFASVGNLTFGNGNITLSGSISGTTGITKTGTGTLILSGLNSQTGAINVNGGVLQVPLIANAGAAGAVVTINGGIYRVTAEQTNTQAFNIGASGGTIQVDPGFSFIKTTNGFAGAGNTLTITGGGSVALTGSGNSSISNVVVQNGIYRHTSTRYVTANATPYSITVQPGSTLYNWDTVSFLTTNYFPYGTLTGAAGSSITLNGDGAPAGPGGGVTVFGAYVHALDEASTAASNLATSIVNVPVVLATTSRFTLAAGSGTLANRTTTDRIVDSFVGGVSGPGGLIVDGDGTGTLAVATVAATYQGNTRVAAGTLRIGLNNALPTGTTLTLGGGASDNTPDASGTFELNAFSQTVAGLTTLGNGTANRIGNLPNADGALIVNYNGGTLQTFSGVIGYTGFRNLTLTKDGTGTLALTGVNLLTRTVSVANGTLALSGAGSIALAPTIAVATGATLDVSGVNSGANFDATTSRFALQTGQTLKGTGTVTGGVTVLAGATIAPGGGTGTLTVTNGVMTAANSTFKIGVFDGSTTVTVNSGLSSGSTPANGIANNFLNITGGGATFDPGTLVIIDGSTAAFTGGDYSYKVAQGAGATPFTINTQSQFTAIGFTGSNYSLSGDSSGNVFLNFTAAAVPEPALLLGLGALGLAGMRRFRRSARDGGSRPRAKCCVPSGNVILEFSQSTAFAHAPATDQAIPLC